MNTRPLSLWQSYQVRVVVLIYVFLKRRDVNKNIGR